MGFVGQDLDQTEKLGFFSIYTFLLIVTLMVGFSSPIFWIIQEESIAVNPQQSDFSLVAGISMMSPFNLMLNISTFFHSELDSPVDSELTLDVSVMGDSKTDILETQLNPSVHTESQSNSSAVVLASFASVEFTNYTLTLNAHQVPPFADLVTFTFEYVNSKQTVFWVCPHPLSYS